MTPILFARAINIAIRKVFILDDLENLLSFYRAREINYGDAEKHYNKALQLIKDADNTRKLNKAKKLVREEMQKTKIDPNKEVLYVDLTGEIYLVCDEFSKPEHNQRTWKNGSSNSKKSYYKQFFEGCLLYLKFFEKVKPIFKEHFVWLSHI